MDVHHYHTTPLPYEGGKYADSGRAYLLLPPRPMLSTHTYLPLLRHLSATQCLQEDHFTTDHECYWVLAARDTTWGSVLGFIYGFSPAAPYRTTMPFTAIYACHLVPYWNSATCLPWSLPPVAAAYRGGAVFLVFFAPPPGGLHACLPPTYAPRAPLCCYAASRHLLWVLPHAHRTLLPATLLLPFTVLPPFLLFYYRAPWVPITCPRTFSSACHATVPLLESPLPVHNIYLPVLRFLAFAFHIAAWNAACDLRYRR